MTDRNQYRDTDFFSKMMFSKRKEPETEKESTADEATTNMDYIQLMENVDTLISLYEKSKPSLQKFNPLIAHFFKNKDK
ncbi:hypothetical protein [Peribacillus huizhouensis]|uniref:Uncharacterized protein n=1 Tax=Peribacillus huizhouensis TaxID=1501239 RepID=A0ABR6CJW0_9BACI|nr:hypothetical protein [Peribacillus huizhouensis]MBA9025196.1 hypothetical protein [Peribacillus huizhouensis]